VTPPTLRLENRVALPNGETTWAELAHTTPVDADEPVAFVVRSAQEACAALVGVATRRLDALLLDADRADAHQVQSLRAAGYSIIDGARVVAAERASVVVPGRITVLTSGTTGEPKRVAHSLESLATMASTDCLPRRWLCPYAPGTYAWYQLAVMSLTVPAQDLVPVDGRDVDGWLLAAEASGVDAISATPTFWRRALVMLPRGRLARMGFRQVTLGGEPVSQRLLNELGSLFPGARITHIYASTEAGACIAVSDGRAGFPADWLGRRLGTGARLRIDADRLFVASPWAGADTDEWINTGDRVRFEGDRVHVLGRAPTEIANVGGVKVALAEVEQVLSQHPDVAWCRVRARSAPLVGELPVADVCLRAGADIGAGELTSWCRERLSEAAVPRVIAIIDVIPTTAALKEAI